MYGKKLLYFANVRDARKHFAEIKSPRAATAVYFCLVEHRHFHKRCNDLCKIPEGKCNPSRKTIAAETAYGTPVPLCPHMLRHTACTQLVRSNGLVTVQRFAGHASIYSTVRYVGMNPEEFAGIWKAA